MSGGASREGLKIVGLCIGSAIVYGIVHDQITARICVEYFTIGHPPIFHTSSPTLLGLGWGVVATWWAGALIGVPLALFARLDRSRPTFTAVELVKPLAVVLTVMGVLAAIAGAVAFQLALRNAIFLTEPACYEVPLDRQPAFLADGAAHLASYGGGFVRGVLLCVYVWTSRGNRRRRLVAMRTSAAPG